MSEENGLLEIIGRQEPLFESDIKRLEQELGQEIRSSSFLVIGGAGSIGQAVTKELFARSPARLHIVDISENNLAELVRDIRSSFGYMPGEFKTFALDVGSEEFRALFNLEGPYDFMLNLSALKHVRSEKDPFTLMRMIQVNILNTISTIQLAKESGCKKYFCVSTDKAANPANVMGATKRIMELFLSRDAGEVEISTARFANVAFSDGSLLHSFNQRILKGQPIVAPHDIKRYFVTPKEAGELCLMSTLTGNSGDIFFPKLSEALHQLTFADIADMYLKRLGYVPHLCNSEEEARAYLSNKPDNNRWPCLFTHSNTTGEKPFEEFYMEGEKLDLNRFEGIGIVESDLSFDSDVLDEFVSGVLESKATGIWDKAALVSLIRQVLPEFEHEELGKSLDEKM